MAGLDPAIQEEMWRLKSRPFHMYSLNPSERD
jgi:hypothetical protein